MSRAIVQSTAAIPPAERFAYWQDTILPHAELGLRTRREDFSCERCVVPGARSIAFDTRSTPFSVERQRRHIADSGADYIALSTLIQGDGTHGQNGRDIAMTAGDLVITDMGRPFSVATNRSYRETRLYIDRALFEARIGRATELSGLLLNRDAPLVGLFTGYLAGYVQAVPTLSPKERETGLDGLLHLLAGLVDHQRFADAAADGPLSLEAIRDLADGLIARHLCSPDLDVDAMVRGLGVSRTRLYAAFAERGGVRAAIRDARLDRVRAQLASAGPIEEIAFAAGFRDYASFSRAFRRRFGSPPRECREDRR
ncbi:MAG: helix-turn-helix domain-containing protein [Methylorubrum rhodinum]|uniref:helix-turn-helix domain-containing protein n=1 Tax=Methylorubrum rhodinum TaxID=29428 RepID=UPI003BB00B5E